MPLCVGDKLGPYEVLAPIGAGGMGEVYRAHDSRLNRDVAIKLSNAQFTERFTREARTIASLNHTNICHLYDVGPNYLVMEYVEGQDLRGPLDFEDALPIIQQLIDGIEAAHEKNIIHRDLKPANIKITPEGVVKILDFGLAKAMEPPPSEEGNPANSPTLTIGATAAGAILGTAAYMAPEQAKGKAADRRSDIWSFGVILYEMLTGQRLFQGESAVEILGGVLNKEPDLSAAPPRVHKLLRWCLEKDRKQRLASISDARRGLEESPLSEAAGALAGGRHARLAPWAVGVAVIAVLTLAALSFVHFREQPPVAQPVRLQIPVPENLTFAGGTPPVVSPDGRWVAFHAIGPSKVSRMWIRALDSLEVKELPGTDVPAVSPPPFWSFDSRFLAFEADGKLKKIDVSGGPPQTIGDLTGPSAVGGAWNRDGVILTGSNIGALTRASASGGPTAPITILAPGETAHRNPQFLPDGRHFLYHRTSRTPERTGIFVGSIDAKPEQQSLKPLMVSDRQGAYVPSEGGGAGWLLFMREGTLLAQTFDPAKLELSGDPAPVAGQVGSFPPVNQGLFSVSANGVLVYRGGGSGQEQLTWFDPQGKAMGTLGEPGLYANPAMSPDGKRVAVAQVGSQGNFDIWVLDASRGTSTRLTFDPARDDFPVWSPDGRRIAFASSRGGNFDLYQKASDGSGDDQLLLKSDEDKVPSSWSPDSRFLLYRAVGPKTGNDLWVLPLEGDRKPVPFLRTEFSEYMGQFSPDGRWIAYISNESGGLEVYVRPFSATSGGESSNSGGKWMISKGGGYYPHWRSDGKQLFYVTLDGNVVAVDVTTDKTFQAGAPKRLFSAPAVTAFGFDVTADGKQFLIGAPQGTGTPAPFTVVLNWRAGLKK